MSEDKRGDVRELADHFRLALDQDELENCMRCGFCQPACPTFVETGLEAASPRGRIALMKAVVQGALEPDKGFKDQMDLCLGCRACEPACPSDVRYGRLIEQTREVLAAHTPQTGRSEMLRAVFLRGLFPHVKRMRMLGRMLGLYQRSGLAAKVRKSGLLRILPSHMRDMERILPQATGLGLAASWRRTGLPHRMEGAGTARALVVPPVGEKVGRVGMFRGCIMDVLFSDTNINTVRLLREIGFEVVIPEQQVCCGALHGHAGELAGARELAVQNVAAFAAAGVDFVAINAGGCGAFLKEYDHLLQEAACASEAAQFAGRVRDISALLVDHGRPLVMRGDIPDGVVATYQDSCHLRNVMGVREQPRALLRSLPGVTYRELPNADHCCGSAGIYNLTQPAMSSDILTHKMDEVRATEARMIVTTNPGCLLQMQWGAAREGTDGQEAVHLVDLLAKRVVFHES